MSSKKSDGKAINDSKMSEGENDIMNIFTYTNFRELSTDTNMAFASGEDGSITSWQRFVYRGYLQIAAFDVNSVIVDEEEHQGHALATTTFWDPMEPTATRPLAITDHSGNTSTTYFHTHDLTKNVCELLDSTGTIITSYDYTPFGAVTASNSSTPNTFCFSSEVLDPETNLVYYNYRYYSPELGRWLSRDPIGERGGWNLYQIVNNDIINEFDIVGLWSSYGLWDEHTGMTRDALTENTGIKLPNSNIDNIINGNLKTDDGIYMNDLSYHYNRGIGESVLSGQLKYLEKLYMEIFSSVWTLSNIKNPDCLTDDDKKICADELLRIGRISHMLQDFYGHAVSMNANTHTDPVGNIPHFSSPLFPFGTKPSSYDVNKKQHGEHGKLLITEPGNRADEAEKARRKKLSIKWSKIAFNTLLPLWQAKCAKSKNK